MNYDGADRGRYNFSKEAYEIKILSDTIDKLFGKDEQT